MSNETIIGLCNGAAIGVALKVAAETGSAWIGFGVWVGAFVVLSLVAALVLTLGGER